jgi:hypothetical protein
MKVLFSKFQHKTNLLALIEVQKPKLYYLDFWIFTSSEYLTYKLKLFPVSFGWTEFFSMKMTDGCLMVFVLRSLFESFDQNLIFWKLASWWKLQWKLSFLNFWLKVDLIKAPSFLRKKMTTHTQNKNWLIQPIYCINQPIRGIGLAMTKKLADSCKKLVILANWYFWSPGRNFFEKKRFFRPGWPGDRTRGLRI